MVRVICPLFKKLIFVFIYTLYRPVLGKLFMSNRIWMSLIMGPIGREQLELFALNWEKLLHSTLFTLVSTNINQSAPNLVTVNMNIRSQMSLIMVQVISDQLVLSALEIEKWTSIVYLVFIFVVNLYCLVLRWVIWDHHGPRVLFHNVFKRLLIQGHQKSRLYGKDLTLYSI